MCAHTTFKVVGSPSTFLEHSLLGPSFPLCDMPDPSCLPSLAFRSYLFIHCTVVTVHVIVSAQIVLH